MLQAPQQEAVGSSRNQDCIFNSVAILPSTTQVAFAPLQDPRPAIGSHFCETLCNQRFLSQGISAVQLFALREQDWPESHYKGQVDYPRRSTQVIDRRLRLV